MTFDPTKPCQTRNGNQVVIYETHLNSAGYVGADIAGKWLAGGPWVVRSWLANGAAEKNGNDAFLDLINIPEEHEVVVTCQRRRHDGKISYIVGKPNPQWDAIASKRITFTEGEFEE